MRKGYFVLGTAIALVLVAAAALQRATRETPVETAPPSAAPAPLRRASADPQGGGTPPAIPAADGVLPESRAAARARNERALTLLDAGDARAAESLLAEACALVPEEPVFRSNLARARVQLGRTEWEAGRAADALAWFARAAEADEDGGAPREWSASVLLRSGDREGAAAAIAAGLALFPRSAGLLRLRAELAVLRGELAAAVEDARAALALEDTPTARERLRQLEEEERAYRTFLTDATAHFDSRYDAQDAALAARMPELHAELEAAWTDVVALLGVQPQTRLLVLWLSPERWSGAAPAWSAGLYDGRVRLLVRPGAAESAALRATMRHELTHALLHALGARLPTWLHEGLAQRSEGRDLARARRSLVARAPRLEVSALDGDWTVWTDPALLDEAYATALSLVAWLEERAGANALPSLLLAAPSEGFEGAWARVFARPFAEWEREHAEWLARQRE
jgi:Flp pilus assembly protein TadD